MLVGQITTGGSPVYGVTVDGGALGTATTDASGRYSFTVPYSTSYTLTPSKTGIGEFSPTSVSGTVMSHATHDFTATYNSYTISGNISLSGSPLAGVTISAGIS